MFFETASLLLIVNLASAQISYLAVNCDFYNTVKVGKVITVNSPGWPGLYRPDVTCWWIFRCPAGHVCRLRCRAELPASPGCQVDKLIVSTVGSVQLQGGDEYCGETLVNSRSFGTRITMGFLSGKHSPGGRFTCTVSSEKAVSSISINSGLELFLPDSLDSIGVALESLRLRIPPIGL